MSKLILFIALISVNVSANQNWIQINSSNSSGSKMIKPSSFNKPRYKKSNKTQGIRLIDQQLINSIRLVQDSVKGINNR